MPDFSDALRALPHSVDGAPSREGPYGVLGLGESYNFV